MSTSQQTAGDSLTRASSRPRQSDFDGGGWLDVSVPIRTGMVHFPGNPEVRLEFVQHIDRGDPATVSQLTLGVHTGTHLDAPVHFIRNASGVDLLPPQALIGVARVIEVPEAQAVTAAHLTPYGIGAGERVLLRTRNSMRCWNTDEFVADYSYLSVDAATLLAQRRVRMIGIDYLSIGGGDSGIEVHHILLGAGIVILEGLDLSKVSAGWHDLICLPLRLKGCDGSPARALVRPRADACAS
jgi:arylformamidase